MELIKVQNKNGLYRDANNNAIINMDQNQYQSYIQNYKKAYNQSQKIKNLENDVNDIKSDLNEIKNLLRGLTNES
jgi:hypothetical protein